jgi:hypothetical protein
VIAVEGLRRVGEKEKKVSKFHGFKVSEFLERSCAFGLVLARESNQQSAVRLEPGVFEA